MRMRHAHVRGSHRPSAAPHRHSAKPESARPDTPGLIARCLPPELRRRRTSPGKLALPSAFPGLAQERTETVTSARADKLQREFVAHDLPRELDRCICILAPAVALLHVRLLVFPRPRPDSAARLDDSRREVGNIDEVGPARRIRDSPPGWCYADRPLAGWRFTCLSLIEHAPPPRVREARRYTRQRSDRSCRRSLRPRTIRGNRADDEGVATPREPRRNEPVTVIAIHVRRGRFDPTHLSVDHEQHLGRGGRWLYRCDPTHAMGNYCLARQRRSHLKLSHRHASSRSRAVHGGHQHQNQDGDQPHRAVCI